MEAYLQVRGTSEDINVEVENWLNSLIEEGYDLSGYTSDELYEAYIEEKEGIFNNDITRGIGNYARSLFRNPQKNTAANSGQFGRYIPGSQQVKTPAPAATRPAATRPATPKPAATPAASRPAAPKPAATAAAKPSGPATGTLGKTSFERRTPTSSELKAAQSARVSGASPEKALQAAKSAGGALSQATAAALKPAAFSPSSSSSPSSTAAAKPSAPSLQQSIRNRRLNMDIDLFDLVKGYLLGEGYAETEESAIVMMVNMSEGWRESILEVIGGQSGDGYIGHPKLGIKNPMSPPKKGVTSAPKNTGLAGRLGNRAAQMDAAMKQLNQSHEIEGEQLDELSHDTYRAAAKERNKRVGEDQLAGKHDDAMSGQDKLDRTKRLRAKAKKTSVDEELELWVEELIAEGYDLSGYTWEEVAEIYAQELELIEAQSARENPEDHDKEDKKKYEKVRGEKTPMPPRGDKRREDFEKWYAANVR